MGIRPGLVFGGPRRNEIEDVEVFEEYGQVLYFRDSDEFASEALGPREKRWCRRDVFENVNYFVVENYAV